MSLFSQISGINANSIKQFSGITDDIEEDDKFDYSDVDFTVGEDETNADEIGIFADDTSYDKNIYNKNDDDYSIFGGFDEE